MTTEKMKPKEFWVEPETSDTEGFVTDNRLLAIQLPNLTHVVEYSAFYKVVQERDAEREVFKKLSNEASQRADRYMNKNADLESKLKLATETMNLIKKHGYGVNIEKNLVIRNTATVLDETLAKIGGVE